MGNLEMFKKGKNEYPLFKKKKKSTFRVIGTICDHRIFGA